MAYKLLVEPAIEPITLADAKQHLRMEVSDDDALITLLIAAARQYAEQLTRTSFITQQWSLVLDAFPGPSLMGVPAGLPWSLPGHAILLEHGPVQSIDSITYVDMSSTVQTMPSTNYIADMTGLLAWVSFSRCKNSPTRVAPTSAPPSVSTLAATARPTATRKPSSPAGKALPPASTNHQRAQQMHLQTPAIRSGRRTVLKQPPASNLPLKG